MRVTVVMYSVTDERKASCAFGTKNELDAFSPDGIVASFLKRAQPFREGAPERGDYPWKSMQ
jgi:hypothetical protein